MRVTILYNAHQKKMPPQQNKKTLWLIYLFFGVLGVAIFLFVLFFVTNFYFFNKAAHLIYSTQDQTASPSPTPTSTSAPDSAQLPFYSDDFLLQPSQHHFTNLQTITPQNIQKLKEITDLSEADKAALNNIIGFSQNGNGIVFQQYGKPSLFEWDLATGKKRKVFADRGLEVTDEFREYTTSTSQDSVFGIRVFPQDLSIIPAINKGSASINLYEQSTGKLVESVKDQSFNTIEINRQGTEFALANEEGIFIVDLKTHKLIQHIKDGNKSQLALSGDGKIVAALDAIDHNNIIFPWVNLKIWNVKTGKKIFEKRIHSAMYDNGQDRGYVIGLNKDGSLLAYAMVGSNPGFGQIIVTDTSSGKMIYQYPNNMDNLDISFNEVSNTIFSSTGTEHNAASEVGNPETKSYFHLPNLVLPSDDTFSQDNAENLLIDSAGVIFNRSTGQKIWHVPPKEDLRDNSFFNSSGNLLFIQVAGEHRYQLWQIE